MNKIFYTLLIAFVSILTFTACDREAIAYGANDKDTSKPEFQGTLNLQSLTVGVIPDNHTGVVLTRSDMDLSSFIVSV